MQEHGLSKNGNRVAGIDKPNQEEKKDGCELSFYGEFSNLGGRSEERNNLRSGRDPKRQPARPAKVKTKTNGRIGKKRNLNER